MCRLTAARENRDAAMARLRRQGVAVTTEDHAAHVPRLVHARPGPGPRVHVEDILASGRSGSAAAVSVVLEPPRLTASAGARAAIASRSARCSAPSGSRAEPLAKRLRVLGPWLASFVMEPVLQEGHGAARARSFGGFSRTRCSSTAASSSCSSCTCCASACCRPACETYAVFTAGFAMSFGPEAGFTAEQSFLPDRPRPGGSYRLMSGFVTPSRFLGEYLARESGLDLRYTVVHPRIKPLEPDRSGAREPGRGCRDADQRQPASRGCRSSSSWRAGCPACRSPS